MPTISPEQESQINNNLRFMNDELRKLISVLECNLITTPPANRRAESERMLTILHHKVDTLDKTHANNILPTQTEFIYSFNIDQSFTPKFKELFELFKAAHRAQVNLDKLKHRTGISGTLSKIMDNLLYFIGLGKKHTARKLDTKSKHAFYEFYSNVIAFIPDANLDTCPDSQYNSSMNVSVMSYTTRELKNKTNPDTEAGETITPKDTKNF